MYERYLELDGTEVINAARTAAYISRFLPRVDIHCDDSALGGALGHSEYVSPAIDQAPWTRSGRVAAEGFYGLMPKRFQGAEDSTRAVEVTELSGNNAVITSPRFGSREIRVTATAFAADQEAMMEGLSWLKQVCAHEGCSDAEPGCTGIAAKMFAAPPIDEVAAFDLARTFYRVEVTEGPRVISKLRSGDGEKWEIEFTLTCGISWPFTSEAECGWVNMDEGSNFQDPPGENCAAVTNAYDDFVADPFFTGISRPPRPPAILPPNILKITSWRRQTITIPVAHSSRFGRVAPIVAVGTELEIQYLRLRFYREGAGLSGCDFDAEAIVSYLPATSTLVLDARTREAWLTLWDGRKVPAGNLLFGSDGRPFIWPSLGCQYTYTMTADLMPGQLGVAVGLNVAVRD